MDASKIKDLMFEINPDAVTLDDFDSAIIGIVDRFGTPSVFLYDWQKCIDILMKDNESSYEEAAEYLDFNCLGAYYGVNTPAFTNIHREMHSYARQ